MHGIYQKPNHQARVQYIMKSV